MRVDSTTSRKPEDFGNRLGAKNNEEHLNLSDDFSVPDLAQTNRYLKFKMADKNPIKIENDADCVESRMGQCIFSSFERITFNQNPLKFS